MLLAQWLPGAFAAGAESLIVPYTESLGHPAAAASPLLAAVPAGMLVGDLIIGRFCRPATRQRLALPLALITGVPLLVFLLYPPLPVIAAALFGCGFGFGYQLGIQQAFLDSLPPPLRGQGFGLSTTGLMGGQGLTPLLAGAVATVAGPAAAMAAAGAATILAACCLRRALTGSQLASVASSYTASKWRGVKRPPEALRARVQHGDEIPGPAVPYWSAGRYWPHLGVQVAAGPHAPRPAAPRPG